ncbi:MAG: hypothetical protein AB1449_14950 [Chloroflexota bacterium]
MISAILDHFQAGQRLKQAVTNGLDAWAGVWHNIGTIARALPGYVGETIVRPVAVAVREGVVQPIVRTTQSVSEAVQGVATSVGDAVSGFIGRLFGGSR